MVGALAIGTSFLQLQILTKPDALLSINEDITPGGKMSNFYCVHCNKQPEGGWALRALDGVFGGGYGSGPEARASAMVVPTTRNACEPVSKRLAGSRPWQGVIYNVLNKQRPVLPPRPRSSSRCRRERGHSWPDSKNKNLYPGGLPRLPITATTPHFASYPGFIKVDDSPDTRKPRF